MQILLVVVEVAEMTITDEQLAEWDALYEAMPLPISMMTRSQMIKAGLVGRTAVPALIAALREEWEQNRKLLGYEENHIANLDAARVRIAELEGMLHKIVAADTRWDEAMAIQTARAVVARKEGP